MYRFARLLISFILQSMMLETLQIRDRAPGTVSSIIGTGRSQFPGSSCSALGNIILMRTDRDINKFKKDK